MFILEEIGNYLESNGIGTQATNIFLGVMREKPSNQVTVVPTGGYILNPKLSTSKDTFQFLVRDISFNEGYTKIYNIFNLFSEGRTLVSSEGRKMLITPMQPPFSLGVDENICSLFAFNIVVVTSK